MPRPKKAKHHHGPESAAATLDELESLGDKLADWMRQNPGVLLGAAVAILAIAGIWGFVQASASGASEEASAALAAVEADYRRAMGGSPDDVQVSEPANVETGRRVRGEYVPRFQEVATEHAGTAAGALASLEAGALQHELGETQAAVATWRAAAAEIGPDNAITALLELRIAAVHEDEADWVAAGEAFERAGAVTSFPLRYAALGDAARCYAEAGEVERALAAFDRIEAEAPGVYLPDHVSSRLRELRAGQHLVD